MPKRVESCCDESGSARDRSRYTEEIRVVGNTGKKNEELEGI